MCDNRDFKGVWIPKEIWLNTDLSALDRVLLAEINSLDNDSHCTASNEYFAKFCGVSVPTITRSIKKLKDLGFIETEMVNGTTGSYRIIKMIIGSNQNDETGVIKMISNYNNDNNIKVLSKDNTTSNDFLDNSNVSEDKPKTKPKKKSLYDQCLDLIEEFTDLPEIQSALIAFLKYRLEIKDKPLYVNQFKGMLKQLDKAVEESYQRDNSIGYVEVIEYAITKGWLSFYPISSKPTTPYCPDTNKSKQHHFNPETDNLATNEDGTLMRF